MPSVTHYLNRAREIGVAGTAERVWNRTGGAALLHGQALAWRVKASRKLSDAALLEATSGRWTGVGALVQHLALRQPATFLLPLDAPEAARAELEARYPGYVERILAQADEACAGRFNLLHQPAAYPDGIDWLRCPETGWQAPRSHIAIIERTIWEPDRPADLKMVWEINRHQHFVALGMAYWLTGDERYVQAFITQLTSWIDANPVGHGINWFSALEIAVRLINWMLAFQFFRTSETFQDEAARAFLKSFYQQTVFLGEHLTTYEPVPNNHLIGETAALALAGAAFPEFKAAAEWREKGVRILTEAALEQTHRDGVNKEQATGYMRFVAEFLLLVITQSRRGALPPVPELERTLQSMFDYLLHTLGVSGVGPLWGDADDGYAMALVPEGRFWDYRWLLAAGAALFGRGDWKQVAGHFGAEAYWLLGPAGLEAWERLEARTPERTSQGYTEGGIYIIRDSWEPDTDLMSFRCGPWGLGGEGKSAHSHCDMLAVLLWVNGRALLVDSGTYRYHGPWRDTFRSTAYHNTLMVDGHEQATPINAFAWRDVPDAECVDWQPGRRVSGAMEVAPGVRHERTVLHPTHGEWDIRDRVMARPGGSHTLKWHFHLAPDLTARVVNGGEQIVVEENGRPYVRVVPPPGVQVTIGNGWFSDQYNHKVEKPVIEAVYEGDVPVEGITFDWRFHYVGKVGE